MPGRPLIFRFFALTLFLVTVAVALWLADLRPLVVVGVMALALLIAWIVEWLAWRNERLRQAVPEPEAPVAPEPESPGGLWLLQRESQVAHAEPEEELAEAVPPGVPAEGGSVEVPEEPAATAEPAAPAAAEPRAPDAPLPARTAAPEPVPPPPQPLRPLPSPLPAPEPPPARPRPAAAAPERAAVVSLPTHPGQAREWNLWDLERLAREEGRREPERSEEWSYLFLHLRQFARADGALPTEFDGLVRESFGRLLERT